MGLEAVLVVIAAFSPVLAARRAGVRAGPSRRSSGMFRAPDLGWPSGVQEDDDLHWSWAAARARTDAATGPAGPSRTGRSSTR